MKMTKIHHTGQFLLLEHICTTIIDGLSEIVSVRLELWVVRQDFGGFLQLHQSSHHVPHLQRMDWLVCDNEED